MSPSPATITVTVPLAIRRRPGRRTVVTPEGAAVLLPTRADPALVKALARAHRWQRLLDDRRYASVSELAAAEQIERGYLGKVLRLTLLAPAIVEAILDGTAGPGASLPEMIRPMPVAWEEQLLRATQPPRK